MARWEEIGYCQRNPDKRKVRRRAAHKDFSRLKRTGVEQMIGNPLAIEDIISELRRGGIRIPELQRNYVWKRSQIARLLDSTYRGFPTGSILPRAKAASTSGKTGKADVVAFRTVRT